MFVSMTCIHIQAFTLMGIRKAKIQNVHKIMRSQQKRYRDSMQFCVFISGCWPEQRKIIRHSNGVIMFRSVLSFRRVGSHGLRVMTVEGLENYEWLISLPREHHADICCWLINLFVTHHFPSSCHIMFVVSLLRLQCNCSSVSRGPALRHHMTPNRTGEFATKMSFRK